MRAARRSARNFHMVLNLRGSNANTHLSHCPQATTTSRPSLSPGMPETRTSRAAAAAAAMVPASHMSCVSSIFFMMALEGTRYMSRWLWLVWT